MFPVFLTCYACFKAFKSRQDMSKTAVSCLRYYFKMFDFCRHNSILKRLQCLQCPGSARRIEGLSDHEGADSVLRGHGRRPAPRHLCSGLCDDTSESPDALMRQIAYT